MLAGVEQAEVLRGALGPWRHAVTQARPFVTWKFASTLDGRGAAADGTSRWVSNALSRADVHALRDVVDAIVVGSGTVLADDPQLTVRGVRGAGSRRAGRAATVAGGDGPPAPGAADAQVFDEAAETLVLDTAVPRFALKALFDRGVRHVLLEGGPTLAGAFLEARLVDEVVAYIAPKLLGSGPAVLEDAGIKNDVSGRLTGATGRAATG